MNALREASCAVDTNILIFIAEATAESGFPPTLREIGEAVGLCSPASVQHHVKSLRCRGLVSWHDGACRTISVAPAGMKMIEEEQR